MTKDSVLAILLKTEGCVSGESVSGALGVSRAAVNAAVQSLRREGYSISSSTKTGYTLEHTPDRLCPGEMIAALGEARAENILCLDSVGSTNDYLKSLALSGAVSGTAVLANEQTAGRGRLGRSFSSPQDQGVYLSVLLRPDCSPETASQITGWTAVAMCRALEAVCGIRLGIKWVNDLVMNGKKLGGILTEMSVEGESGRIQHIVVGVGINVNQPSFAEELADIATSIFIETGRQVSRCTLAAAMIAELDAVIAAFPYKKSEYLDEYRERCATIGRDVSFELNGDRYAGRAESITEDFGLTVVYPDGTAQTVRSGEVSVRGMFGDYSPG